MSNNKFVIINKLDKLTELDDDFQTSIYLIYIYYFVAIAARVFNCFNVIFAIYFLKSCWYKYAIYKMNQKTDAFTNVFI
jgi:hypothetical protein